MLSVEYLRNGERYSSSVFTLSKAKSHASNWYKRRLCSCYRFRDIKSSTSRISNADLYERCKLNTRSNEFVRLIRIIRIIRIKKYRV